MRSWMSIATETADTAEPNSASMASPAVPTKRPLPVMIAGRQTSVWALLEMAECAGFGSFHHSGEAGEVCMDDRRKAALHGGHDGPSLARKSPFRAPAERHSAELGRSMRFLSPWKQSSAAIVP